MRSGTIGTGTAEAATANAVRRPSLPGGCVPSAVASIEEGVVAAGTGIGREGTTRRGRRPNRRKAGARDERGEWAYDARMKSNLALLGALAFTAFASLAAGCGGNVTVGTGGSGATGAGGAGGSAGTTGTAGSGATGTPTFGACNGPGECMLAVPGCCSPCGMPELGAFVAINVAEATEYHNAVCPEETPCPACDTSPNPNLFAYCDAGKCVAADVRQHPVSACATGQDCHLRYGSGCCEGCGPASVSDLIAVSWDASPSLPALVCSPNADCPECLPGYPPEAAAFCADGGHCEVVLAGSP